MRAGVFIGVAQTGGLQRLEDATHGARRMYKWALSQGMEKGRSAHLITDENGPVTPDEVFEAIQGVIDGPGAEQLIVYFAGHGVNIARNEYWLMSKAPRNPSAAVDVRLSAEFARYCGIQHVVLISDACRVAPEGIEAQSVTGIPIFPNEGSGDRTKPVDQFFACLLGRTAAEVKDPTVAADSYSALYTGAVLDALTGQSGAILERGEDRSDTSRFVKPVGLQQYLAAEVPRRISRLRLGNVVNQEPDAIIVNGGTWLSRITPPFPSGGRRLTRRGLTRSTPNSLTALLNRMTAKAVVGDRDDVDTTLEQVRLRGSIEARQITETVTQVAQPFGPGHFESGCGIKIRGAGILRFQTNGVGAEILGSQDSLLHVEKMDRSAANVLLQLSNGLVTIIPVIKDFLAGLTLVDDELVDVAYEPSETTPRSLAYQQRADEVRSLRAIAASSSQHGRFQIDPTQVQNLSERAQVGECLDLTLALYAAYAYYDIQEIGRIEALSNSIRADIGVTFFDLELLSRRSGARDKGQAVGVLPFTPLLSHGWGLVRTRNVEIHPTLQNLGQVVGDSVWSVYPPETFDRFAHVLTTRRDR